MYDIFVIFYGTQAYDIWMKAQFLGQFVCMWFSCEHMYNMRSFNLMDSLSIVSHNMSPVISSATASISTCNSWTVCGLVRYNLWGSPKGNTQIHVRWTWWPGPPITKGLWKSVRRDTATKHIKQGVQGEFAVCGSASSSWKNVVSTVSCSLNDRDDLIF